MLSRREIEEYLGHPISDAEWNTMVNQMADIQQKMWEEEHPMDD